MSSLFELPEVRALGQRTALVRIPPELDVPLTERVRALIDTPAMRRLRHISQLGLVSLVYPAAHHTRFEHSLGVFRLALLYLRQLAGDRRFAETIEPRDAELLLAAALTHDIGHWPFCHPIEDIRLPGVPDHESLARRYLLEGEVADVLGAEWGLDPADVLSLLSEQPADAKRRVLDSILSGPIDIDKMDYLARDSLHAGVPYGRNFDQQRLLGSLCLNAAGDGLAITEKGKTAAEMMVFARYVMFSEVYWHHAVRSATAMLQRAFYLLHAELPLEELFQLNEYDMIGQMIEAGEKRPAGDLLSGLFGPRRRLYKRLAQYSYFQQRDLYKRLAGRPYPWLATCSEQLARLLADRLTQAVPPHHVLFDAPPVRREIEFKIDVLFAKENAYRSLAEVSPVVRTLAQQQFDDYVKRVRIYIHPDSVELVRAVNDLPGLVHRAIDGADTSA